MVQWGLDFILSMMVALELILGTYLEPLGSILGIFCAPKGEITFSWVPVCVAKVIMWFQVSQASIIPSNIQKNGIFQGFFHIFPLYSITKKNVTPIFGYFSWSHMAVSLECFCQKKKLGANPLLGVRSSQWVISSSLNKIFLFEKILLIFLKDHLKWWPYRVQLLCLSILCFQPQVFEKRWKMGIFAKK